MHTYINSENEHKSTDHSYTVVTSKRSHSHIAENSPAGDIFSPGHSLIVDHSHSYTSGSFNKYPPGIVNPAFTGMVIWEIKENHPFNDYSIPRECNLRSGIVMKGNCVFVFTPIMNNDIKSYVKPLLKSYANAASMPLSKLAKKMEDFVRISSRKNPIPSLENIETALREEYSIKINDIVSEQNQGTYETLLHRLYLLIFMVHYKMPKQRRHLPGRRNQAKDRSSFRNQSWYSYLSPHEQHILENPDIEVMTSDIPEDNVNGMKRHEMFELGEVSYTDHLNTQMFRKDDGRNSFTKTYSFTSTRMLSTKRNYKTKNHVLIY